MPSYNFPLRMFFGLFVAIIGWAVLQSRYPDTWWIGIGLLLVVIFLPQVRFNDDEEEDEG